MSQRCVGVWSDFINHTKTFGIRLGGIRSTIVFEMTPRGRYRYHSTVVKKRLLNAFDRGEDWIQVASVMGVKYSTALSLVKKYKTNEEAERHGSHRIPVPNETELGEILDWIADDCTLTLEWMCLRAKAEFRKEIPKSTLARYLDGQLITTKKLHLVSETMNSCQNKRKR